jgi:hypothetical protein
VLERGEAGQHVPGLDRLAGDVAELAGRAAPSAAEQRGAFFLTGISLVPVTRTRRAAFAHATIRLTRRRRCERVRSILWLGGPAASHVAGVPLNALCTCAS